MQCGLKVNYILHKTNVADKDDLELPSITAEVLCGLVDTSSDSESHGSRFKSHCGKT